jgi:dihydrofolate synthase / folylpolyglutamate synthase
MACLSATNRGGISSASNIKRMSTTIQTFDDLLAYLARHTNYEQKQPGRTRDTFDLERVNEVLDRLVRPELAYVTAHVAGTKGKGSTARFLAAMMQSQGLKVGLFTSPHLEHLTERIAINGEPISERTMIQAFQQVVSALDDERGGAPDITFFELLTLSAMIAFRDAGLDAAVFEVGLGGRLDSTNVISPAVSVITEIGLDHTQQLGDTIAEIAREKAGIIKPGVPVVCGTQQAEAVRVISLTARDVEAPLLMQGKDFTLRHFERRGLSGHFRADVRGARYENAVLHHPARYMAENAARALCALEVLATEPDLLPEPLDRDRALDALARTAQPGRFEVFDGAPALVVDSAHNEVSLKAAMQLARTLATERGGRLVCVGGLAADKDVEACIRPIAEHADACLFTTYYNPRECRPEDLLRVYTKFGGKGGGMDVHPEAALESAVEQAGEDGLVLVTGSTYLAGLLRPAVRERSRQ